MRRRTHLPLWDSRGRLESQRWRSAHAHVVGGNTEFLLGFWVSRRRMNAVAGLAWLLYGAYETAIQLHVPSLCSGDCSIRVDLLLIYPLLFLISVAGLVAPIRWQRMRARRKVAA